MSTPFYRLIPIVSIPGLIFGNCLGLAMDVPANVLIIASVVTVLIFAAVCIWAQELLGALNE